MNNRSHKSCLVITYEKPLQLSKGFQFRWQFPQNNYDDITVQADRLIIEYRRKSRSIASKAFCKTRVEYLRRVALLLACLEGCAESPIYASASFSIDGKDATEIELSDDLRNLVLRYSGDHFSRKVIKNSFGSEDVAKVFRIAVSYYWAASNAYSQEERLKLLWGSFNALYRWIELRKVQGSIREVDALDKVNGLFINKPIFNRAVDVFVNEIETDYENFVRWKLLTGTRSRSIFMKSKSDSQLCKKRTRLRYLDEDTLVFMRDYGCENVGGKAFLKTEIEDSIANAVVHSDRGRKIAMLICRYTYVLRCDAMHANIEYPVFRANKEPGKHVLGDLLEATILDLADWIADIDGKA